MRKYTYEIASTIKKCGFYGYTKILKEIINSMVLTDLFIIDIQWYIKEQIRKRAKILCIITHT